MSALSAGKQARMLSSNEHTAVSVVTALVGILGALGFVNSFTAVMTAARPSFGGLAFTVPLGVDLGIAIFAALDIVLARLDMRLRWLRLIPWTLTGATVYLNISPHLRPFHAFAVVAHTALPALWVIAVEIGAHVARVRAGIEAGTRMESVRTSRWVLAPWPTLKLWRRMVLWEIRAYPTALDRERARLLALTDLKDTYGAFAWRWKAPRRVKALYRLGELTPAEAAAPTNLDKIEPNTVPVIVSVTEVGPAVGTQTGPTAPAIGSETYGADRSGVRSGTQVPIGSETGSTDRSEDQVPTQVPDLPADQVSDRSAEEVSDPGPKKAQTGPKKQTRTRRKAATAKPLDRIDEARAADAAYLAEHGRHIPAEKLASALRIGKPAALELVKQVRGAQMDIAK